MPAGQGVLPASTLDIAEVDRLGERLETRERARHTLHAAQLVDILALHRAYERAGMSLGTSAQVALLMGCSESRAEGLLSDARVLERLGALAALVDGLLTVEQARTTVDLLGSLEPALAASLWERLSDRLLADHRLGVVRPPARLRELLSRWLLAADPHGAADRRRAAQRETADVEVWRREDGLVDLAARALSGPNAQANMQRIAEHAQPVGPYDERTVGERRRDALVDLLSGRASLPFEDEKSGCHCPVGAEVPCGSRIYVHVPLQSALDSGDQPAELVGHGPLDRGLLFALLAADPVLQRVSVDASTGVPVAVDDRTWRPGRDDPLALREVLLDMATGPPPSERQPIHRGDHRGPHLDGEGPYGPSRRQRRLVRARAPRCEWPGCGRRAATGVGAAGCDLDHDVPWPHGPTCACNLGPLCRRHHRIKQLGWLKNRNDDGSVRWTSPTGRTWLSPGQHDVPRATRPVPPVTPNGAYAGLDPLTEEAERLTADPSDPWLDGAFGEGVTPADTEPVKDESLLRTVDDLWSLLHDPTSWHDVPPPAEGCCD